MKVLFVCTANKLRSPTAERVFRDWPGIEAISAGTDPASPRPLTKELVASADMIFAMEKHHREWIRKKFKERPSDGKIFDLGIPDEFERDDPVLVKLLEAKVGLTWSPKTGHFAKLAANDDEEEQRGWQTKELRRRVQGEGGA
ncbi:hypothetical protein [Amaricoccus solimangrovi]|uniref:hypothetical protein n=1 Tax=Amaricoccus solimangrovi TaxID=2589815 RepID=UPI001AEE6BCD|nr:hypothetical protein [Amaricoccus solimangrovi]